MSASGSWDNAPRTNASPTSATTTSGEIAPVVIEAWPAAIAINVKPTAITYFSFGMEEELPMVAVETDGVKPAVAGQTVAAAVLALVDCVDVVDIGCELHT